MLRGAFSRWGAPACAPVRFGRTCKSAPTPDRGRGEREVGANDNTGQTEVALSLAYAMLESDLVPSPNRPAVPPWLRHGHGIGGGSVRSTREGAQAKTYQATSQRQPTARTRDVARRIFALGRTGVCARTHWADMQVRPYASPRAELVHRPSGGVVDAFALRGVATERRAASKRQPTARTRSGSRVVKLCTGYDDLRGKSNGD